MSTTETRSLCQEVEEALSELLDGTAPATLFDHVAECDACRDLKHEAATAAARVRDAGATFRPADDFVEKLVARLEAARPASSGPATLSGAPAGVVVHTETIEPGGETAPTTFDPLAAAKAGETTFDPLAAAKAADAESESASARPDVTRPSAREAAATTHHGPITRPEAPAASAQPVEAPESAAPEKTATSKPGRTGADAPARKLVPAAPKAPPGKVSLFRRPAFLVGAAGAMAAAAAVGFYMKGHDPNAVTAPVAAPWSGAVASVSRAAADQTGGLSVCNASGACTAVAAAAVVPAGATLRTDARTRAHVTLADGTDLAIDRATEVSLERGQNRSARLVRGTVVADVAHVGGSTATIAFPRGEAQVLGTRLAVTASDDRASVEVARGSVRVTNDAGKTVDVRAGEEATLAGSADPVVSSSSTLADVMEWSDNKPEDVDSPLLRGLGELRARRPGQTTEKDRAVRLAKHGVKVRIVDVVARTEVDETFTNDTDEELEGIFRFPLPPGAQIEKLSLEVEGKMIDGAFVDREKGAAIWRGVIQNAAPKTPRPREEIIWVPGPWRDPALLEWQRGGRFELKIFPIPRRGSRRVVLTYTQTVEQSAGIRRFTYPLAHDPSGSTKINAFDLDVQVLGLDKSVGLTTRGYDLAENAGRRTLHADDFVPAGDLTVEYALPDRDKEVTAWAFAPSPPDAASSTVQAAPAGPADTKPAKPKSAEEQAAEQTASAILDDRSPYVAIAVRPKLPRWQEAKEHLHVIVVDASRSMFGERFARATHLTAALVREMDRRDAFMLLACDTICRPMTPEQGGSAQPQAPGAAAADDVERFLGSIEPEGGSNLAAAMAAARTAAGPLGGKELRILYLGDGTPSVGPTRPSHLETAVHAIVPSGDAAVVAVALGADADTTSLLALARGGGGVMVPYVPGQKVSTAALEVLSAAYGVVLRDPEVELPAGLSQVTPARLDPIRAGGETLLVARMSGGGEVSGTLKLRGRVAGERFEQTYPLKVLPSSSAGNAFVPRLYAAAKIAEIERSGGEAQRATVVELSKRFAVASRFTSLLVLESEAMFKAFGLDRSAQGSTFTGEQQAESSTAKAEGDVPGEEASAARDEFSPLAAASAAPGPQPKLKADADGLSGFGHGAGGPGPAAAAPAAPPAPMVATGRSRGGWVDKPVDRAAPAKSPRPQMDQASPWSGDDFEPPRRRRFIPMHKVFERHVAFDTVNTFLGQNAARLTVAESALAATPNSRDRTVDLVALYSTVGRVNDAQELTAKWAGRDALDPDALQARSDLAARQGDRERAVRILGGLADLRPNDRAVQTRLAVLWETAGNAALACEHRIALADMAASEAGLVATAITCARAQGQSDLAAALRLDTTDKVRESVDKLLASPAAAAAPVHGDVQITGSWTTPADLDVALIDTQGKRTSWLGSPTKATVSARDVTSTQGETLEIAGLPQGNYVLEVSRAAGRDTGDTVRGEVSLRLNGEARKVPFTLTGARAELGTVRVFFTSHLEPVTTFGGGWR
jgi:ferric-dicitrate binding protein FerR (iron transport regulator)/Mg-chelatase subunit ChlD